MADSNNVSWEVYTQLLARVEQNEAGYENLKSNMDQFFLITMGIIVFLMQGGFAFLEAGAVRSKNSTNILIKNLFDAFVAGVAYWTVGYAFAYGKGNSFIGYADLYASSGVLDERYAHFFFQYCFAATAATIVSGAMAERCNFLAYFVYSFFITAFVYPVVSHWAWATDGWMGNGITIGTGADAYTVTYLDYAGSGSVHCLSGVAAMVGAAMLGPRLGRFHPDKKGAIDLRGHSVPFAALGGFILLFGFLAFNGGSELAITGTSGITVSRVIVNTVIGGSFGAFTSLIIHRTGYFGIRHWSLLFTLNGCLAGMVAVCSGCNILYPWGSAILGVLGAMSYRLWSWAMIRWHIDDPLDAVAVHLGGGLVGVIGVAFLGRGVGIVFVWNQQSGMQLVWQLACVSATIVWTGGLSLLLFGSMRLANFLRVSEDLERKGLDIPEHGEPAYPMEAYGHGWVEQIMQVLEDGKLLEVNQAIRKLNRDYRRRASDYMGIGVINAAFEEEDEDTGVVTGYDNPEVVAMNNHTKSSNNGVTSGSENTMHSTDM